MNFHKRGNAILREGEQKGIFLSMILAVKKLFGIVAVVAGTAILGVPAEAVPATRKSVPVKKIAVPATQNRVPAGDNSSNSRGYFFQNLVPAEKIVYDYLTPFAESDLPIDEITIQRRMSDEDFAAIQNAFPQAITAFLRDHPEIFWCDGFSWSAQKSGIRGNPIFHYKIKIAIQKNPTWARGKRSTSSDFQEIRERSRALARRAKSAGRSRAQQLLFVHDWLTKNNVYNSSAKNLGNQLDATAWSPLSALSPELRPVCEGYSRAFYLVCRELGVPCLIVSGEQHMWNYVQLENGKWYAVDVTNDDPVVMISRFGTRYECDDLASGKEHRDNFLVGFRFLRDHHPDANFRYPQLSATDYIFE